MKNDQFPRTLSRGILRGQTFQSQADYARALREAQQGKLNGRRIVTPTGKARCAKCGEWKSAKRDFYPMRKAKSGIQSYCIACTRANARSNGTVRPARVIAPKATASTWRIEVTRPDGTVIRADLPAADAARLLG